MKRHLFERTFLEEAYGRQRPFALVEGLVGMMGLMGMMGMVGIMGMVGSAKMRERLLSV